MRTIGLASMLAILLISVGSTCAAVSLTNASWESPDVADLANTNGTATGWTSNAGGGVFDPQNAWFAGTTGDNVQGTLPNGGQVGFTNNLNGGGTIIGQMTQNVGTIGANERYTLTVAVGRDALGTAFG